MLNQLNFQSSYDVLICNYLWTINQMVASRYEAFDKDLDSDLIQECVAFQTNSLSSLLL